MSQEQYHDVYKLVLLGDSGVGKTNMITNFVKGTTGNQPRGPTLGIEYSSKTVSIDANHVVKVQIWDTAGQQQYRSITTNQLKKALGALVVFDITNRRTFDSVGYWVRQLREKALENVSIIIVGNKIDKANSREVSREEAQEMARQTKVGYAQTSANDIRSLNSIFTQLSELIAHGKRDEQNNFTQQKNIPVLSQGHPISQDASTRSKCC